MREKSVVAAISLSARTGPNSQPLFASVKIITLFPLSIAASEQESSSGVCVRFPFAIVVVEMWCEYIRACTARTHLLLYYRFVWLCVCSLACVCAVCDLSRAHSAVAGFFCVLCAAGANQLQAVDIQQWQRAHTNSISTVETHDFVCFLVSFLDRCCFHFIEFTNFWKQPRRKAAPRARVKSKVLAVCDTVI